MENKEVKRGEVFYADLSPVVGSEQGGTRPVLILQNDVGNKYSPTVIAAAITSRQDKNAMPTHIGIKGAQCGLPKDSIVLLEQVRTIDKRRLHERTGRIDDIDQQRVDEALNVSLGLTTF
ncbi:MAG: type II toxin-antitoxin system PemK/MazF family toxin [Pygmaiobacter sp.]